MPSRGAEAGAELSPARFMMFQLYKLLHSKKKKRRTWQVIYASKNTSHFLFDISLAPFLAVFGLSSPLFDLCKSTFIAGPSAKWGLIFLFYLINSCPEVLI